MTDVDSMRAAPRLRRANCCAGNGPPARCLETRSKWSASETLTGVDLAPIWSEATGKAVSYAGDDLDAFEGMMGRFATATQARDMRMMFRAFHKYGMAPEPVTHSILAGVLGGSSRRCTDFARETVEMWRAQS